MDESRYYNRELSLLDFQERVLAVAVDPATPLLERLKFVAIVSSNLDEFFQVRIAGLQEQAKSGITATSSDGMTPREQLEASREKVLDIVSRMERLFADELLPALDKEGIRIVSWEKLSSDDRTYLGEVFEHELFPVLTPLAVDPSHPFPYISNLSLNLAVLVRSDDDPRLQFARIKVPPLLPRFYPLPDGERFIPIEQVIGGHLDRLFAGREVIDYYIFRVTRDADIVVEEEEANDLLEAMESVLRFRKRAAEASRLEIGPRMTEFVTELLMRELDLTPTEVFRSSTLLGLSGLWSLWGLDRSDLKYDPWTPTTQPRLSDVTERVDFFREIKRGDILVHWPYESFATSVGAFLAQAAADPNVLAIKQTLYRTSVPDDPAAGGEAAIVRSLMAAAQAGKQVVVLVELKARFDEEANINWAKMLEDAGVHVVYGVAGLKTHSKILLVVRREGDRLIRYSNVGTGNYNPKTARLYEDLTLFTADPDIGADLSELFNALTGYSSPASLRKLLVAPTTLRSRIVERISEEGANGPDGRIVFKLNHLVDPDIIDELYAASQQGCRIDLIVRGICCLRAGVPGLSESIRVRSIVGMFLEHSRVYRFGHPPDGAVYYMGSADMMQRNLNRRVETLVPVTDPALKRRLEEMLEVNLADDALAWTLQPDGTWSKVVNEANVDTQRTLQAIALRRARGEDAAHAGISG